jgi:hypothetical protein
MAKEDGGTSKKNVGSAERKNTDGVLEERVAWIQRVGWGIVALYGSIFVWFAFSHFPKELEYSRNLTKLDIEQAAAPIRQDLAVLTERLRKQVSFNLQALIPPAEVAHALEPAILKARFQEASSLINTAIAERIPATPAILRDAQSKLRATLLDTRVPTDVRSAATAALVGFEAYNVFSSTVVVVNAPKILVSQDGTFYGPVTIDRAVWLEGTGKEGAIITVDFTGTHPPYPNPAAFVIAGGDAVLSKMRVKGKENSPEFLVVSSKPSRALVNETRIENLTQKLGGVTWVNVDFVNSVIRYSGEPTYLGNVTFTNCKYEFGSDAVSKWVLAKISQPSGPVTLASTVSF